jgi:hypothetical protein
MDKVQNPSHSDCYTSSSEPFRIYLLQVVFSLLSNLKLYKEDKSPLATMVSSQLQYTEIQELEDLITEPAISMMLL